MNDTLPCSGCGQHLSPLDFVLVVRREAEPNSRYCSSCAAAVPEYRRVVALNACRCDGDGWYIAHDNELRECPAPAIAHEGRR